MFEARASTWIDSNHPRRASVRTSVSTLRASSGLPVREEICATTALGEICRSPVNEISLMSEVVVAAIAVEISACAGERLSGGLADVAPERHGMLNNPERSQRKIVSPCTRRMTERMSESYAGLSGPRNNRAENDGK